jgi:hypothetical protein
MTIKTQGGKVITKGGKVSCGCCEEPGECCMYPAQALADGLYTYQDLPDSIEYLGTNLPVVLNKLDPPEFSNRFDGIAYFRGTYEFSGDTATVDLGLSEDIWVVGDSINDQARTNARCLIDLTRTLDQFADTYTITIGFNNGDDGPFYNTYTATRISLCYWDAGIISDIPGNIGKALALIYDPEERLSEPGFGILIGNEPGSVPFTKQDPPESNTPVGIYDADSPIFLIQVS